MYRATVISIPTLYISQVTIVKFVHCDKITCIFQVKFHWLRKLDSQTVDQTSQTSWDGWHELMPWISEKGSWKQFSNRSLILSLGAANMHGVLMLLFSVQINNDKGEVQVLSPKSCFSGPGLNKAKVNQFADFDAVQCLGRLPGSFGRRESFCLHLLFIFQEVSPLGEIFHPLSRAICLKLALEVLAGRSVVIVVIQTFPQLVPGFPAGLPFCRVWSGHCCLTLGEIKWNAKTSRLLLSLHKTV